MKMTNLLGVVCGLVLASAAMGCANESSARASGPSNPMSAQGALPQKSSDDMWIGPTRAESTDPTVLAWQTDVLAAIGRDGEFYLFDYVVSSRGAIFVGINYATLRLTPEQLAAAQAVNAKYAATSASSFAKGDMWLASQKDGSDAPVADSR
jgi:hypothetical protein